LFLPDRKDRKLTVNVPANAAQPFLYTNDSYDRVELCVQATPANAVESGIGVIFWATSYNSYYVFNVSDGKAWVSRLSNNGWLRPATSSVESGKPTNCASPWATGRPRFTLTTRNSGLSSEINPTMGAKLGSSHNRARSHRVRSSRRSDSQSCGLSKTRRFRIRSLNTTSQPRRLNGPAGKVYR